MVQATPEIYTYGHTLSLPSALPLSLLDNVAHPPQGLDVVDQGRPAEHTALRHVGRAVARQAALALDALDHRGLLAADVGAGAAAQIDCGVRRQPGGGDGGQLRAQRGEDPRVFLAASSEERSGGKGWGRKGRT